MKKAALFLCLCSIFAACSGDSPSGTESPASSTAEAPAVESSSSNAAKPDSTTKQEESTSSSKEKSSSSAKSSSSEPEHSAATESSDSSHDSPASSSSEPVSQSSTGSSSSEQPPAPKSSSSLSTSTDDGKCTNCDSYTAADPELTDNGGKGSVTTYGSITEKETSLGGACNYGQTNIQYYAAIHVNVSPGDNKGPWQGGAACGGCVHVKAKTPDGWKEVTVRITDRCPDANCGVDLGGAPASDIMGITVGRYYGEWEFVSCEGVDGVWGDSTSLWVKEGASKFWSIVQVRNPKDMVKSITITGVDTDYSHELEMVVGTENFWTVPPEILQTDKRYRVTVKYRTGEDDEWNIKGSELAEEQANLYLHEHRN